MDKADEQLMLIGGTALLYAPAGAGVERQAAFDSILYAQLVANKEAGSRFADHDAWYDAYRAALRRLGWIKLASTYDQRQLGQPTRSTRLQPLDAWLKVRSIQQQAVLAAFAAGLGQSADGVAHLKKFCVQDQAGGSQVVIELGLLKPGPVLDLCSITLHTETPLSGLSLAQLLSDQVLKGEAAFNGISLALDNKRFQHQREALHALMLTKDGQGEYRFDPHAPQTGAGHE
ncbi:hypothetical protein [Pseudomonas parafulva]|uniref:hypothetical protein n=1 Tax=Pseudomonas parafulva TaxID=157782 RepID=UPI000421570C|nr:hypothetical protein [Pseudomonas parafulva]